MEYNTIAERLIAFREDRNISSRKVALSIGIDPSQYLKIEKGALNLPTDKIEVLCSAYNISSDWLLTGKGGMFTHPAGTCKSTYN